MWTVRVNWCYPQFWSKFWFGTQITSSAVCLLCGPPSKFNKVQISCGYTPIFHLPSPYHHFQRFLIVSSLPLPKGRADAACKPSEQSIFYSPFLSVKRLVPPITSHNFLVIICSLYSHIYVNLWITKKLLSHSCTFQRGRIAEGMLEMSLLASQCPWTPLDPIHRLYVGVTLIIVGKYWSTCARAFSG